MGLNHSLTALTSCQSLIILWSTIEALFKSKSAKLFNKKEQKGIVKFIKQNVDSDKAELVNKLLPELNVKTKNDLIIENILKMNPHLKPESLKEIMRRASKYRAKCSHDYTKRTDEKEVNRSNNELRILINYYVKSNCTLF
jgi:hypothetical protein